MTASGKEIMQGFKLCMVYIKIKERLYHTFLPKAEY
jgi:hypothetical protein